MSSGAWEPYEFDDDDDDDDQLPSGVNGYDSDDDPTDRSSGDRRAFAFSPRRAGELAARDLARAGAGDAPRQSASSAPTPRREDPARGSKRPADGDPAVEECQAPVVPPNRNTFKAVANIGDLARCEVVTHKLTHPLTRAVNTEEVVMLLPPSAKAKKNSLSRKDCGIALSLEGLADCEDLAALLGTSRHVRIVAPGTAHREYGTDGALIVKPYTVPPAGTMSAADIRSMSLALCEVGGDCNKYLPMIHGSKPELLASQFSSFLAQSTQRRAREQMPDRVVYKATHVKESKEKQKSAETEKKEELMAADASLDEVDASERARAACRGAHAPTAAGRQVANNQKRMAVTRTGTRIIGSNHAPPSSSLHLLQSHTHLPVFAGHSHARAAVDTLEEAVLKTREIIQQVYIDEDKSIAAKSKVAWGCDDDDDDDASAAAPLSASASAASTSASGTTAPGSTTVGSSTPGDAISGSGSGSASCSASASASGSASASSIHTDLEADEDDEDEVCHDCGGGCDGGGCGCDGHPPLGFSMGGPGFLDANDINEQLLAAVNKHRFSLAVVLRNCLETLEDIHKTLPVVGENSAGPVGTRNENCRDAKDLKAYGAHVEKALYLCKLLIDDIEDYDIAVDRFILDHACERFCEVVGMLQNDIDSSAYEKALQLARSYLPSTYATCASLTNLKERKVLERLEADLPALARLIEKELAAAMHYKHERHTTTGPMEACTDAIKSIDGIQPFQIGDQIARFNLGFEHDERLARIFAEHYEGANVYHRVPPPPGDDAKARKETTACGGHAELAALLDHLSKHPRFPNSPPATRYFFGAVSRQPCGACMRTIPFFAQKLNVRLLLAFAYEVKGAKACKIGFVVFGEDGTTETVRP